MNTVAIHYKTLFYLDSVRSPRFKPSTIDKAVNAAISDIILDRYNNIRKRQKEYSFQSEQRLRDELYSIVKKSGDLVPTNDVIAISSITDYWLLLALEVYISGKQINTIPLTYDEKNIIENNPYTRPSILYPQRVYRIESSSGIEIIFGDVGSFEKGIAYYLKKPAKFDIGTKIDDTSTEIESGTKIVGYVDSTYDIYSTTGGIMGSGTLAEEEEYTVPPSPAKYIKLTSGVVYKDYTDTDLPDMLHEEVCRKAAAILSGTTENYNRENSLEKDIKNDN